MISRKPRPMRPSVDIDAQPHPKQIEQVYIAVTEMENGSTEAVYSVRGPDGQSLPVVAVGPKDLHTLAEFAQEQVKMTGRTVSIIGFTKRMRHETFRPPTTGDKK